MVWTSFWDMHSGGGQKEKWSKIFIEAPQAEAEVIFQNRFGHNPYRVTCTCCGDDYSVDEHETLEQATGYHRGCAYGKDEKGYIEKPSGESWRKYMTLEEYFATEDALAIYEKDILPDERVGELREQGYVWMD